MIRKNATSSLKWAILRAIGAKNVKNIHRDSRLKYKGYKETRGKEKVVAIIRNPYERALSNWKNKLHDQANNGRNKATWTGKMGFKMRCSFEEYLEHLQAVFMLDGHTKPQVSHLPLQVDYMIDMDNLDQEWPQLQKDFRWLPDLPKKNMTEYKHENFEDYYTSKTKALIEKIYSKDVTLYRAMKLRVDGLHDVRILQETTSGARAGQQKVEIDALAHVIEQSGATSYLEVGARYGDTFIDIMRKLPKGSKGVCVDLPGHVWGSEGTQAHLEKACDILSKEGYEIHLILGDSTIQETINIVEMYGPYDAALLDGDHRYEGIKKDFESYSPFIKKLVALHDIVGVGQRHSKGINVEVPRFWNEIKTENDLEFVGPGSAMGIGVKWII